MKKTAITFCSWPLAVVSVLLLTACAGPQNRTQQPAELPGAFSQTGQLSVNSAWWTAFDDRQLDRLVRRALDDNLSLQAGYQRLRQARAVADRQRAGLFPTLNATAGAEQQESDTLDSTRFSGGLSASYEVDLWGRVQALSEAEALRAAATLADYQAAAVSLSSEIATTWFQLVEQRAQQRLAETQLDTNKNVLTVIESRFATGQSSSADVLRQRQLVSASRERLSTIAGEMAVLAHQLSVLMGRSPVQNRLPDDAGLPDLPALPDTGVPGELVQRRPDLRQAWLQVQAADETLAAAISNRFPRFSIEASVNSRTDRASELFDNWLTSLAGNMLVPLVDGGALRAEVRRSRAVLEERVQQYGQAVLTAIQEVEDALVRERQQNQRLQSLRTQARLADTTYQQVRGQYLRGTVSYIEVLNALQGRQDLQRTILNTRQQLLTIRIALYRALAGSIDIAEKPENEEA